MNATATMSPGQKAAATRRANKAKAARHASLGVVAKLTAGQVAGKTRDEWVAAKRSEAARKAGETRKANATAGISSASAAARKAVATRRANIARAAKEAADAVRMPTWDEQHTEWLARKAADEKAKVKQAEAEVNARRRVAELAVARAESAAVAAWKADGSVGQRPSTDTYDAMTAAYIARGGKPFDPNAAKVKLGKRGRTSVMVAVAA